MTIEISGTLTSPNNPRICYNNLTKTATVTTSTAATGFAGTNTQNALTYNFWKPTTLPATIDYDIGANTSVNYCGIAAHNLFTSDCSITIQRSNDDSPETFTTIDTQTPADDSVILFLFDSVSSTKYRILVEANSTNSTNPSIGVVYFGQQMITERRIYAGHEPITLSKNTIIRPNKTEGGQWVGRSIVREGANTSIDLKNLTPAWVRSTLKPFMDDAISNPFFFAWRPTDYSSEVAYCWTTNDITPSNNGRAGLMDVSFKVNALLG